MADFENEDAFDEEGDDNELIKKEYVKVKELIEKEGYREGFEHGHGTSIQHGFNTGYKFSANKLFLLGKLKGNINGVLSFGFMKPVFLTDNKKNDLENLLSKISEYEQGLFKRLKEQVTAKLIAEEVQESITINDQTSSLYVEDDYTDFLGLKSETFNDVDAKDKANDSVHSSNRSLDANDADILKSDSTKSFDITLGASYNQTQEIRISNPKKSNQLQLLSDEIEKEIAMFKSDFIAIMS